VKVLLDQNLSFRLVELFLSRFPGSRHVRDVGLTGEDDERI
jgi:predicted nuclease of predicted toxin-antitoxin system